MKSQVPTLKHTLHSARSDSIYYNKIQIHPQHTRPLYTIGNFNKK